MGETTNKQLWWKLDNATIYGVLCGHWVCGWWVGGEGALWGWDLEKEPSGQGPAETSVSGLFLSIKGSHRGLNQGHSLGPGREQVWLGRDGRQGGCDHSPGGDEGLDYIPGTIFTLAH